MMTIKNRIVEILRKELENQEEDINYSQWVMGVSISKARSIDAKIVDPIYTAKVVVKTSESPYVDGMEINFSVIEDEVIIEVDYYEKTPDYQGGTEEDSIKWLGIGEIYYLQLDNPFNNSVDNNN